MNVIQFIKKNYKYLLVGLILISALGWSIYSGILNNDTNRRLQQVEGNLGNLGEKISASNILIGELKADSSKSTEIVGRIEGGLSKLDTISRAVEAGNRRQEEIYRGLAGAITKIQSGLIGLEGGLGKLSKDLGELGNSMDGNLELISEGLEILNGLPK